MSALLQLVPRRTGGAIQVTNGATPPDHFANGLPYEADSTLAIQVGGTITHHWQGLPFNATGRLVSVSVAPVRFGSGAAPFDVQGRLCMQALAVTHTSSGVGYTASSSVAIA